MKDQYTFTIEPLTAVHIGTGEAFTPLDYIVKEIKTKAGPKELYFSFSWNKILKRVLESGDGENFRRYNEAVESGNMGRLRSFFHCVFKPAGDLNYCCDVTAEFKERYKKNIEKDPVDNALEVFPLYRPAGAKAPVIPGTSLKGAMRTALLNWQLMQEKKVPEETYDKLYNDLGAIEKRRRFGFDKKIQEEAFGTTGAKQDPLRALRVEDVFFPAQDTQLVGCMKNIHANWDKRELQETAKIQIQAEILRGKLIPYKKENSLKSETTLTIDRYLRPQVKEIFSITNIREAYNSFYFKLFNDEWKRFYENANESSAVVAGLKKELEAIQHEENSFIIRIGRWSQVEFITYNADFRYPNTPVRKGKEQDYGTTRTVFNYDGKCVPMGWCKCTFCKRDRHHE